MSNQLLRIHAAAGKSTSGSLASLAQQKLCRVHTTTAQRSQPKVRAGLYNTSQVFMPRITLQSCFLHLRSQHTSIFLKTFSRNEELHNTKNTNFQSNFR
jgi:hypothetical protein